MKATDLVEEWWIEQKLGTSCWTYAYNGSKIDPLQLKLPSGNTAFVYDSVVANSKIIVHIDKRFKVFDTASPSFFEELKTYLNIRGSNGKS